MDLLVDVEPQLDTAALGAHVEVAEEAVEAVAAVVPDVRATRVAEGGQRIRSLVECRENRHFTMFQSKIQYKQDINEPPFKLIRLNICDVTAPLCLSRVNLGRSIIL